LVARPHRQRARVRLHRRRAALCFETGLAHRPLSGLRNSALVADPEGGAARRCSRQPFRVGIAATAQASGKWLACHDRRHPDGPCRAARSLRATAAGITTRAIVNTGLLGGRGDTGNGGLPYPARLVLIRVRQRVRAPAVTPLGLPGGHPPSKRTAGDHLPRRKPPSGIRRADATMRRAHACAASRSCGLPCRDVCPVGRYGFADGAIAALVTDTVARRARHRASGAA